MVNSRLKVISANQMAQIHEAGLEILDRTGVVVQTEEARRLMADRGCRVDGKIVHIPPALVEEAIETAPSTYRHHASNPERNILVGHRQKKLVLSGQYGPVFVLDGERGRRPGTLADYADFLKIFQASDQVNVVGGLQVEPSDADKNKKFFQMTHLILRHTDKSLWGFYGTKPNLDNMFRMVAMALGIEEDGFEKTVIGTAVCPLSPLRFTEEHCDTILGYARRNQAVFINSCIMAGISGPISLLGTATLINAEILAGLVMAQLAKPGAPVVYVSGGTVADFRTGLYSGGGPESNLIVIAGLQMAIDLYKLPTRVMGGLSDAKMVDYQAGAETMQNVMMPLLAGAHFLNNTLGNMDGQMISSYEKLILDLETIHRVLTVVKGIEGEDSDLETDLIADVAHAGNYAMHPDTFHNFRRRWRPSISIWEQYDLWQKAGAEDLFTKARRKVEEILAQAPEMVISPELDRDLAKFVEKVETVRG